MRTVRNTVDTRRTGVCTIHQPSIDIFEPFDELVLLKVRGQIIYAEPLCRNSHNLVKYFEEFLRLKRIIIQLHGCWKSNLLLLRCKLVRIWRKFTRKFYSLPEESRYY